MSRAEDMIANAVYDLHSAGIKGKTLQGVVDAAVDELTRLRRTSRFAAQALTTANSDLRRFREQNEAVRQTLRDHDATASGDLASAVGVALSRSARAATQPRAPKRGELVPVACDLGALTNADVSPELRIRLAGD